MEQQNDEYSVLVYDSVDGAKFEGTNLELSAAYDLCRKLWKLPTTNQVELYRGYLGGFLVDTWVKSMKARGITL